MKRTILILILVAAVSTGAWFGLSKLRETQAAKAETKFETVEVVRGDLESSVGGTGTVQSNQSGVVSWQTTGIVGEMAFRTGSTVREGQRLAVLRESSLPQSMILARADLVEAQRALERLNESDVARATAYQNLVAAQKELDSANTQRLSKEYRRGSDSTIKQREADLILAQDAFNRATDLWNLYSGRDDSDVGKANALSNLAAAQKALDRARANLDYVQKMPNDTEVNEADARIQVAEARFKDAQAEWDRLKSGPDAQDIAAAEARILAIQNTLAMDKLTAPFAGTITEVKGKPGDLVQPGTPAYRIDDLSRLVVNVDIPEVDINRIAVGQETALTFDAIRDRTYRGRVVEVAQVGTNAGGVVNFTIKVELENPDEAIHPGMTAAVTIATEQAKDVLLIPYRAVRLQDGKYFTYVLRDGVPVKTAIVLGLSSDNESEVREGLKEGDLIVLNPPADVEMRMQRGF